MIEIDDTCLLWDIINGLQKENKGLKKVLEDRTDRLRMAESANEFLQRELMFAGVKKNDS